MELQNILRIFELSITTKDLLKFSTMYYQVFLKNKKTGNFNQHSIDTFHELQELVEKKKPKFLKVHYYNCFGLVGLAYQYFNFSEQVYKTYKKVPNFKNPHNQK